MFIANVPHFYQIFSTLPYQNSTKRVPIFQKRQARHCRISRPPPPPTANSGVPHRTPQRQPKNNTNPATYNPDASSSALSAPPWWPCRRPSRGPGRPGCAWRPAADRWSSVLPSCCSSCRLGWTTNLAQSRKQHTPFRRRTSTVRERPRDDNGTTATTTAVGRLTEAGDVAVCRRWDCQMATGAANFVWWTETVFCVAYTQRTVKC